jgi:transcription elongation factor Elf1
LFKTLGRRGFSEKKECLDRNRKYERYLYKGGQESMEQLKCSDCGSNDVGQGIMRYEGKIQPVSKTFSSGSNVMVDICTNCGLILKMKVEKPELFK